MKTHLLTYLMAGVTKSFSPKERPAQTNVSGGKSPKLNLLIFILALMLLALGQKGYSQTNTWTGGTNWFTNGNWTQGHYPTAAEDVIIPTGNNVTVNNTGAVCKSLTINGGLSANTITINGTNTLTVTNAVTINAPSLAGIKQIAVGNGTLTCGSISLANTTLLTADCQITASGGTVTVSGNITMNGDNTKNAIIFTGAGTLNLGGNMTGGTFTCATSTVNCNGAAAQTIAAGFNTLSVSVGYTFYKLNVVKTAAANTVNFTTGAFTVNNDFSVTTGTASLTATDANYTVVNDVNIGAAGTLVNTVDYTTTTRLLNVGGDWTNNGGTFTPGTGLVNFNTAVANQNIQGTAASQTFNSITVNKTGRLLTVAGSTTTLNLDGTMMLAAGTFVAGTASNINIADNWTNNGGAFTPGTGTVTFNDATITQNINGSAATQTFNNIIVNKPAQQLNVAGSTTTLSLTGSMTLTDGTFTAGTAATINIAGNWTNNGGIFTPGTGTVVFNSTTATQNINGIAAAQTFNSITVAKTAQQLNVAGSTTTLNLNGNMTLTSGIFAAGTAADINMLAGNWTNNGSTFTPGTGTVTFNSTTGTQNINGTNATQAFNNIVVNKTGQQLNVAGSTTTLNVSETMTLTAGAFAAGTAGNINMTGDDWINNGGTFIPGSGTVNFTSTTAIQNITGTALTQTFNHITVNKTGQQLNVSGSTTALNLNGNMTLTAGTFVAGTAANINIAGNWTNAAAATFTPGAGTVTFNNTTATQNINGTATAQIFNNIVVSKSGQQLNVAGSAITLNVGGTMTLTAGTFAAGTAANINMTAGDWINNGGAFTPGTGTVNFTSTVAVQNITGTAASQTFNNLVINKAGQQLNIAGSTATLTLNGAMTLTAGTFSAGTATNINVAGNWTNNGTAFIPGAGRVTFNAGTAQNISGSAITDFYNVTLNNSNGLTLTSVDVNINGAAAALTFTNGKITTGSHVVNLLSSGTISGAAAGRYVYGNLQLGVATGSPTRVFEIGDASVYAPVSVVFNNVTVSGNVTAYTIGTEHPNILTSTIDESRSVNRYWSMTNSGTSLTNYTPTYNWVAGDVDAGATTANFIIGRRAGSWAYPTMGAKNPTNCTTTLTSFGTYACGEGGAGVPVVATQPVDQSACSGSTMSYVAAASNKPNSTVVWEISTDGGTTFSTLTIASPYSVLTNSASGVTTSTLTINPTAFSMDQYSYRAVFTNSRGTATSFDGLLTLTAAPTANAGSALTPICGGSGSSASLGGSVGGSATGGTWSTPSGGTFTPGATNLNATWTPPVGFTGTATLTLTSSGGPCGTATDSKTQVVAVSPSAFTITPSSATVCLNTIQPLTAGTATTLSSGTISVSLPNNTAAGGTSTLAVAGVPAGATISAVSVTFNVTHSDVSDLYMNLRAPNGNILNLANRPANGTGTNFTSTVVSSMGNVALSSGTSPFTGTFAADAASAVGATGQSSNVTAFSSLYSTPNGNWVLSGRDASGSNGAGTITSWSITIVWSLETITWSPITNLYTNPAATTAYTGTGAGTVYCKLPATGTTTYTATATNGGGCTATQTSAITAGPVVTITPDYCYGGGFIQLQASSTPAATGWLWNTGATTSSILVNLAGNYTATATTATGCVASTTASIAQELVVNGDFSSGNTGFTSLYGYVTPGALNMYPEATYTVNNNPNTDHSYFFGNDHTTSSGKMLIVNGSSTLSTVWQATIPVQPNTTYYFSAWAVSVNDVAPYAQLQFDINGSGIGTTAVLPAGPNNTSTPSVWQQFYGSWTSGAGVTSATVIIKDLQTALGGNDFAIDDISFGTLSTFVNLTSGSGTDTVRTCKSLPMTNITYSVGAGATGPSVTGLPPGVSYSFNGVTLTISGTPTTLGTYSYTVTNSSCNPITKYGQIIVTEDTLTLTSAAGTDAQSGCLGAAITNITYSVGTSASGATATGLPPGVTGTFSAGVFTISGTPTTASTYSYTVTTTGSCSHVSTTGTIYVRRQIITRSSAVGTNAQTICVNTAITNITYSIGGVATGAGVTGLPAGITGSYSSGVFTISGTATAAPGVYNYLVTTTGPCNSVTAAGTVTVNGPTVTLSSAVGTDAQMACVNTAITNITYNIAGTATGVSGVTGLPSGISWSFNSGTGVLTISGTATATGVNNYIITTSGGTCGNTTANGSITVTQETISLSSSAGSDAQTRCVNTAITNITYLVGGSATGAAVSGLPAGVTGSYSAGVYTISGMPTASGTFNYTVTTSGTCSPAATASGTIIVSVDNTAGAASSTPTLCINTALTAITHTTTGATGIGSASGLPAGVSASWASNTITISGTPTASGTFNYSIPLTGGCGTINATGTITVTASNIAGAASSAPTLCINTTLTAITHTTTGATGIGSASGLPAGVSASWASNTITIVGTPTVSGIFNYSIPLTGGCGSVTATGTITVNVNTITLSSAAGTNAQTRCINTAITNITYSTTGATGATFSGLPTGVTGSWASNVATITGTPSVAGTATYTVTLTGGCGAITATGTIAVTANNTVTLSSAAGTNAQTRCINTAITNITYSTTGATGATFSGLPTGVTGSWASNVATITGTPSVAGTATYTVTLTGGCGTITATGTIAVTANNTITLSSAAGTNAQTRCINTAITNITYSTTGATGATFSGLPTGVTGSWASNVATITGTPSVAGTATYTVTLTGGCGSVTATGTITVNVNTITLSSAAGTNAQTRCINTAITNITYSTTGATGASFSGLPTGVTGSWASNVATITGTPSVAGTATYTVTLTGGCGSTTATGTITVNVNTITLSSAAGTNAQTRCINTAITNITYSTTGATGATFSGLPTGVTGSWASNVATITGTPSVAGTATYTVTLTGGCGAITATGTIAVTANNTVTLSSAAGTNAQTRCINTAITNITYSTTGATGATFSGLPTGVTGSWASNVATITGTPSVAGTATYTVTLTGGCGSITATGTIAVTANNTVTLSSVAGTNAQTRCINTAITNITYSTTGATGATFSGLPTGVTGSWASNVATITGTPSVAGTATYTVTLTGGCGSVTATGTITVNVNTITLSSAAGTNAQTRCINTAITNITYSTTGATGASFSGLPTGVTGSWASNVATITGTPSVAGTATYTVTLTGGCGSITATGTITVNVNTITLSSAAGTNAQTRCINTAITNITYSTTGATGATFSGLPTGVTGSWASNVATITGTPSVAGTATYTVTLTGGCGAITATGTIAVTANNTVTLSSAAGTNAQTRCINTAITNITYSTTGATGASFSGLPTGVTGSWASNVATITGTPSVAGTATYTVTLTGGCGSITATGTIAVTANNTVTLSSAAGTNAQTRCINTAITNITYSTTGATGATFSGLPTGVTGSWASNVATITGTPSVAGTATYTVTLTGGCGSINATGTITVDANNTATFSSAAGTNAQTICINTAATNITYVIGGSATGASVSGLPAGISGSFSAGIYTISGTPTVYGTFSYTVTATGGSCAAATATGSVVVSPAPAGGTIADVSICFADNGNLTLTGNVGAVTRWETSNDGSTWTNIANTTTTQSFASLTQTTWYRALVQSGACASTVYSNTAKVGIHNLWTGQTSSDWNTGSNWSDGQTPTTSCPDVTIPLLTLPNVYPQLTSGVATVNNIIIYPSATMLVSNATLQVAGTITNNGTLDVTHGTLELNGTSSAQTIAGSIFSTHTIQNLTISNSNGVSFANTNDTLRLTGVLNFGTSNAILNTNDNLTLVSNAAGTASVGDLTNGGTLTGTNIIGNATVERYIPFHPKAWQFLAVPTSGQSIKNAWQEGNTTLGNTRPGYGSIITGEMSGAVAAGFDIYTVAGPSMKTYNATTNTWVGVTSTTMQIANKKGYMFFIRGDRSVTAFNQAATATTMRTTGKLFTFGADAPSATTVSAGKFESIGNPYASAIDFTTVSKPSAPDVDDVFYVWDPLLTNNYLGLGGYQTISAANSWKPIPGGTTNYDANIAYPYVQSGQAFIVHATGAGGTVNFSETNKVNQYSMANRVTTTNVVSNRQFLKTYLYNASSMLSDGNVVAFDNNFSNAYDANDALKLANTSENLSIIKGDKYLALEARSPVVSQDTVFYTFGNIRRAAYQLRFNPENMVAGLTAKLVDKFLNTVTPVSMTDTSSVNFSVTTDAGSWAADRFYIIFDQAPPVAITAISATRANNIAIVRWKVEHEAAIAQYEMQKSADGNNFSTVMLVDPTGNNTGTYNYDAQDANSGRGTIYYRVKGVRYDATEIYSAVVKIVPGKDPVTAKNESNNTGNAIAVESQATNKTGIVIYPNPVVDKVLNIQFFNQTKGLYKIELVNKLGQIVFSNTLTVASASHSESIHLNTSISSGIYQLKIKTPENTISVQQVVIQ